MVSCQTVMIVVWEYDDDDDDDDDDDHDDRKILSFRLLSRLQCRSQKLHLPTS